MSKPLVSLLVLFYNHEEFVYDCLNGVFSQEYENVEISIRDDCSSDRTKEKIKSFLSEVHRGNITVEYGNKNIGLLGSYNNLLSSSNGAYVVACAGDDIMFNSRVKESIYLIQKYNCSLLFHNARVINELGIEMKGEFFENVQDLSFVKRVDNGIYELKNIPVNGLTKLSFAGFSFVYERKMLEKFNFQLPKYLPMEDGFLQFVAALNKGVVFYNKNLMSYRRHHSNMVSSLGEKSIIDEYEWNTKLIIFYEVLVDVVGELDLSNSYYSNEKSNIRKSLQNNITLYILKNIKIRSEMQLVEQMKLLKSAIMNFNLTIRNFKVLIFILIAPLYLLMKKKWLPIKDDSVS